MVLVSLLAHAAALVHLQSEARTASCAFLKQGVDTIKRTPGATPGTKTRTLNSGRFIGVHLCPSVAYKVFPVKRLPELRLYFKKTSCAPMKQLSGDLQQVVKYESNLTIMKPAALLHLS